MDNVEKMTYKGYTLKRMEDGIIHILYRGRWRMRFIGEDKVTDFEKAKRMVDDRGKR